MSRIAMLLRLVKQECAQGLQRELAGILTVLMAAHPVRDEQAETLISNDFLFNVQGTIPYEVHPGASHVLIVVTDSSDIRNAADLQSHRLFNRKFQCGYLKLLALTQGVPFVFLQSHPVYGRAVGRTQITDLPLAVL